MKLRYKIRDALIHLLGGYTKSEAKSMMTVNAKQLYAVEERKTIPLTCMRHYSYDPCCDNRSDISLLGARARADVMQQLASQIHRYVELDYTTDHIHQLIIVRGKLTVVVPRGRDGHE